MTFHYSYTVAYVFIGSECFIYGHILVDTRVDEREITLLYFSVLRNHTDTHHIVQIHLFILVVA